MRLWTRFANLAASVGFAGAAVGEVAEAGQLGRRLVVADGRIAARFAKDNFQTALDKRSQGADGRFSNFVSQGRYPGEGARG